MPPASAVKGAVRRRRAPGAGKTDSEGRMSIQHPYLLFLGDAPDQLAAKTAQGIAHWRPDWCVGQLRLAGCQAGLGFPTLTPEAGTPAGGKTPTGKTRGGGEGGRD